MTHTHFPTGAQQWLELGASALLTLANLGTRVGMGQLVHAHGSCLQATGSWDATIRIWDLRTGTPEVYQELEGHSGNISCLCYSASGLLVSWLQDPWRVTGHFGAQ